MGDETIPQLWIQPPGNHGQRKEVQVAADQPVTASGKSQRLSQHQPFVATTTNMLAQMCVHVLLQSLVPPGAIVEHDGIHLIAFSAQSAQSLQIEPHDPRDATICAEEFRRQY